MQNSAAASGKNWFNRQQEFSAFPKLEAPWYYFVDDNNRLLIFNPISKESETAGLEATRMWENNIQSVGAVIDATSKEVEPLPSLVNMWFDEDGWDEAVDTLISTAESAVMDQTTVVGPAAQDQPVLPVDEDKATAANPSQQELPVLNMEVDDTAPTVDVQSLTLNQYGQIEVFTPRLELLTVRVEQQLPEEDKGKVRRLISSLEMSSVRHSNGYDDVAEFQQEAERFCNTKGLRISIAVRSGLRCIWESAQLAVLRNVKAKVESKELQTSSKAAGPSKPPLPSPPPQKARPPLPAPPMKIGYGQATVVANPRYKGVPPKAEAPKEQNFGEKVTAAQLESEVQLRQKLEQLWSIAISAQGKVALEFKQVPPKLQQKLHDMYIKERLLCPFPTLVSRLGTWKRFKEWCQESDFAMYNTEPYHIRMFLHDQQERGTTVAKSQLAGLRWLEEHLGVNFHTKDQSVQAATTSTEIAEIHQAIPISVRIWITLERATEANNQFVQILAATWIVLILSSLRYAHLQRSRLIFLSRYFLVGLCALSKGKRDGRRRPYKWVIPRLHVASPNDFVTILIGILSLPVGEDPVENQPTFILPDFGPPRASLAKVNCLLGKAMPIGRFHVLSRQLLQSMNVDEVLTSYRARRLLPTVADLLQYPAPDRARLGAWASKEVQQADRDSKMANRYSHHAVQVEGIIRAKIAMQVRHSISAASNPDNIDWPELLIKAPSRAVASELVAAWRGDSEIKTKNDDPPRSLMPVESQSSDEQSSTSSSSSSSSSSESLKGSANATAAGNTVNHSEASSSKSQATAAGGTAQGSVPSLVAVVTPNPGWPAEAPPWDVLARKIISETDMEELSTAQITTLQKELRGVAVFNANFGQKCLVISFPKQVEEFKAEHKSKLFLRYHACAVEAIVSAAVSGRNRMAAGWARTAGAFGVYVADQPEGAAFYAHCRESGLAAVAVVLSAFEGKNVGKNKGVNKTNRCLTSPFDHVVAGAIVFAWAKDPQTEQPEEGAQYPLDATEQEAQELTSNWPQWYSTYVRQALGLDKFWKFTASPVIQKKATKAPQVVPYDLETVLWAQPKSGRLIHLIERKGTEWSSSWCGVNLSAPYMDKGFQSAKATGRNMCKHCIRRTPQRFQDLVQATGDSWLGVEPV